jgi:hypothetical protein
MVSKKNSQPPPGIEIRSSSPKPVAIPTEQSQLSDQFPYPYKTRDKIVVLHILIFKLLDFRREDRL